MSRRRRPLTPALRLEALEARRLLHAGGHLTTLSRAVAPNKPAEILGTSPLRSQPTDYVSGHLHLSRAEIDRIRIASHATKGAGPGRIGAEDRGIDGASMRFALAFTDMLRAGLAQFRTPTAPTPLGGGRAVVAATTAGTVTIQSVGSAFTEQENPVAQAAFTVTASPVSSGGVYATYRIDSASTAVQNVDYVITDANGNSVTPGSLYIPSGQSSATIYFKALDDADDSSNPNDGSTLELDLVGASGCCCGGGSYAIGSPSSASLTIQEDGVAPTATISPAGGTITEAENPTAQAAFTVNLGAAADGAVPVNYEIDPTSTAILNTDYVVTDAAGNAQSLNFNGTLNAYTGTLTIPQGRTSGTLYLKALDDTGVEPSAAPLKIDLLPPSAGCCGCNSVAGYTVGSPSSASITIQEDDGGPVLTIQSVASSLTEAETPTPEAAFTITRAGSTDGSVSVPFVVALGSNADSSDYVLSGSGVSFSGGSGSVYLGDGQSSATISVTPLDDAGVEPSTVDLTLALGSPPANCCGGGAAYTVGSPGAATISLYEDDTGPPITLQPISGSAVEGQAYSGAVATFKLGPSDDGSFYAPASDFTASIAWGDGTVAYEPETGSISGPDSQGNYTVTDTNLYTEEGTYPVAVTVNDINGASASGQGTMTVADAPLAATGTNLNLTEGSAFTGTVATFSDANPYGTSTDFTATIHWGDNSISAGTVQADPVNEGQYSVLAADPATGQGHAFDEGSYPISVTIVDVGGSRAGATGTASVADAPLTAVGDAPPTASVTGGSTGNVTLASFTDANLSAPLADFSAVITWGDGQTSFGQIAEEAGPVFTVTGSHTYNIPASAPLQVAVLDEGGQEANVVLGVNDKPPSVAIDINDTADPSDDITSLNSGPNGSGAQTINAAIMDAADAGPGMIQLSASRGVTFSRTQFPIAPGQTVEVTITPTAVSQSVDDVVIQAKWLPTNQVVGTGKMTVVQVTIPRTISLPDTPAGMKPRISLGNAAPFQSDATNFIVTPDLFGSGKRIGFAITGSVGQNGTAIFTASGTASFSTDNSIGPLFITGKTQTASDPMGKARFAGRLRLVAMVRGQAVAKSDGFSVAAIPTGWSEKKGGDLLGVVMLPDGTVRPGWGLFTVPSNPPSDSGNSADLKGGTLVKEQVKVEQQTDLFKNLGETLTVGRAYAPIETYVDRHFVGPIYLQAPGGVLDYIQSHTYRNLRVATLGDEFPMPNSGYEITQTVNPQNRFNVSTVKVGKAVGDAGDPFASGAGNVDGTITGTVGPNP